MLRSILCDYSDAYILVKGTIIVTNTGTQAFTDCISGVNYYKLLNNIWKFMVIL